MNKRIYLSLAIIMLAIAAVGGATSAWFTDSDEVGYNQFTSGTLIINIDGFDELCKKTPAMHIDRLNPGDEWCYKLTVENEGNKTFFWKVGFFWDEIIGQENTYTQSPEMIAALEARSYGTNKMSEVLEVTIWKRVGSSWTIIWGPGNLPSESPLIWDNPVTIAPGEKVEFNICFKLPGEATGNEYQGAKMQAGIAVQAWQTTNNAPAPTTFENPFNFWSEY